MPVSSGILRTRQRRSTRRSCARTSMIRATASIRTSVPTPTARKNSKAETTIMASTPVPVRMKTDHAYIIHRYYPPFSNLLEQIGDVFIIMKQHQNKTFIELGPWARGQSYLEPEDLEERKQFVAPNDAHLHKRTFLHLPRLTNQRITLTKPIFKMSHQSLDLVDLPQESKTGRYGALNGSVRKSKQQSTGRSVQLRQKESQTIDLDIPQGLLQRKMSTVQMGDAVVTDRPLKQHRRLVNQECAKKRGLMQFIKEVSLDKDFMQFYLQHRGGRAYSCHPEQ